MAIDYPAVNGNRFSWASVEIILPKGKRFRGIKAISAKDTLEPGEIRGTAAQLLGRTRGDYKAESSIEMWKREADEFIAALGNGFMEYEFDIPVSFSDRNQPVSTIKVLGCRIKGKDESYSMSTEGLAVKFDLSVMGIITNGYRPLLNMIGF
jgi:hypothetical protein